MAVMQMQRVSICALKRDRKAILEKLQTMGVMEMTQVLDDESGFEKMDTQGARNTFEKKANLADLALDILQEYAPEKKSLLSSLEGKKLIEKEAYNQVAVRKEEMMDIASRNNRLAERNRRVPCEYPENGEPDRSTGSMDESGCAYEF